jgi:exodeoxyribonuclease-3
MSWNVNSIRIRISNLVNCLLRHQPDVVCLQELKGEDLQFPYSDLEQIGYNAVVYGQKTYNGVAILAKKKPNLRCMGIPGYTDVNARYLEVAIDDLTVACIYAPNGESLDSEKFQYKIQWYNNLLRYLEQARVGETPFVIAGDFNIAPNPSIDTTLAPEQCERLLCSQEEVAIFQRVLETGLIDTTRYLYPVKELFTWWDYRANSFLQNKGMRIDHILASRLLSSKIVDISVDRLERSLERPSDHAPLIATFKI